MNIVLWVFQGFLATVFLMAGSMKVVKSKNEIKENGGGRMNWVDDVSANNIKLIGIAEVLAGVGLILPQLTNILPWLTPLAGVGLIFTMTGAVIFHLRRGDGQQAIVPNIVLMLFAAFVTFGRFILVPA